MFSPDLRFRSKIRHKLHLMHARDAEDSECCSWRGLVLLHCYVNTNLRSGVAPLRGATVWLCLRLFYRNPLIGRHKGDILWCKCGFLIVACNAIVDYRILKLLSLSKLLFSSHRSTLFCTPLKTKKKKTIIVFQYNPSRVYEQLLGGNCSGSASSWVIL